MSNSPNASTAAGSAGVVLVTPLLGATLVTMCVLGVTGNLYTLAIMRSATLRRAGSMYVFILNLAAADLLYLGTIPFVVCTYIAHDWFFGEMGCRLLLSLDLLTMHASVFVLVAQPSITAVRDIVTKFNLLIRVHGHEFPSFFVSRSTTFHLMYFNRSLERYRAVAAPFRARRSTVRIHWLMALGIWVAAFVLTLPMMLMIRLREGRPSTVGLVKRICFPTWTPEAFKTYLTALFFTSMLLPGLLMVGLYAGLAWHYWAAQDNLTHGSSSSARRRRLKHKVLGMIFCIVVAYWACFLPFWGWQMAKLFSSESLRSLSAAAHTYVNFFVTCLTYGNSCINPLLYTLLTRNYRDYLAQRGQSSGASRGDQGSAAGVNPLQDHVG